jgi:WD repeat-containing protein 40A
LQDAHEDLIFDVAWISDRIFVSGSRDSSIAAWKITSRDLTALQLQQEYLDSLGDLDVEHATSHGHVVASFRERSRVNKRLKNNTLGHRLKKPTVLKNVSCGDKVRALAFNVNYPEVAAVTLNAYLHVFDGTDLRQVRWKK